MGNSKIANGPSREHPTHPPTEIPHTSGTIARPSAAPLSSGHGYQTGPILQPRCSREGPSLMREALHEDVMAFNL